MSTRISLAQFGILFAVLLALGAVAHADSTRSSCGLVGKVSVVQRQQTLGPAVMSATVEIEGQSYPVTVELAQLAMTAKASGQRLCAKFVSVDGVPSDQGYTFGHEEITFTTAESAR